MAILTGLLIGVYAGLVLLATRVLSVHSPVAVAASTLAGHGCLAVSCVGAHLLAAALLSCRYVG